MTEEAGEDVDVLANKRHATRYRILVEIAERQPAVNQSEIADSIGVTSQAVSHYLQELVDAGHVDKEGRGRYEVTKEGVDWLIGQTDALQEYTEYVSEDVVGGVDTETVVAATEVEEGDRVHLSMEDGVIHAREGGSEGATAVAVTSGGVGEAVAVTDFEGLLEYEPGDVTLLSVPRATIDSADVHVEDVEEAAGSHDLFAVAGTEALAVARRVGHEPDVRFGVAEAVREAAARGVDVYVVAVENRVSEVTDALSEDGIGYEVVEVKEA